MKKNVGSVDTIVRFVFAIVVTVLYAMGIISGTPAIVLGALSVGLIVTGLVGWCGIYVLFGISTRRKNDVT